MTISWSGFAQKTPFAIHVVSIILMSWGTYGILINDFVNAAPIDAPSFKEGLNAWMNWLCPAIGLFMQFIHKAENAVKEG